YRAMQLAGLAAGLGKNRLQPSLPKKSNASLPAGQVLSQIIIYHIQQVICAQQAYLSGHDDDTKPLHNLRISLRRLRALLSFAKPLLPKTEYSGWQSGLADWNRQLGRERNLDVFKAAWDELNDYMAKLLPNRPIKPALTTLLADKRQQVRAVTYNAVATGQITPVLLGLWAFIEARRIEKPQTPGPNLKEFVEERLAYRLKRLLKRGKALALTDCHSAHELRIAAKNLRYALEALAPILQNNTRLLCKRLEKLQDLLGSIQDITLISPLLQQLVKASASRLAYRDAGLITGWQLAKSTEATGKWVKVWTKVEKAAGKFNKLHPPTPRYPQKRSPER
ncbi:MAG: CHAD domain-containing protein, partial [Sporomusa sp.]